VNGISDLPRSYEIKNLTSRQQISCEAGENSHLNRQFVLSAECWVLSKVLKIQVTGASR
jgi:hypothetical protein